MHYILLLPTSALVQYAKAKLNVAQEGKVTTSTIADGTHNNIVRLLNVVDEVGPNGQTAVRPSAREKTRLRLNGGTACGAGRAACGMIDGVSRALHAIKVLILVWELVEGMDMLDYINYKNAFITEKEARCYFKQLLDGVKCIHDNGFCHR